MAHSTTIVRPIAELFEANGSPENALPMKRYMRDQFDFLGIKTPVRRRLVREYLVQHKAEASRSLRPLARALWQEPLREYQYAALDLLDRFGKTLGPEDIPFLETLITDKPWWDTVDALASRIIGGLLRRHPLSIDRSVTAWRTSDDMWLRRTAILFQLKYREDTDEELLFAIIRENAGSKEFFLQKAIGWALREYSKVKPESVRRFVRSQRLASLSQREALKWLLAHPGG